VGEGIGWDSRLQVTADGKGLVKDAGLVLLRKTADVTGLTARIAEAFGPGRVERICRGTVLVSAAVAIAGGARNLSQVERALAHHAGTFGATGSDSTLWRALDSIDDRRLRRLQTARRRARKAAWRQLTARPGGFPWLTIGGKRLDKWVVVDLDATLVECHSAKERAAGTYKGGWGVHPLGGWVANTGETLVILPRPGNAGANTAADHRTVLEEVLDQLPDENKHTKVLIRIDGAGASHETIERIVAANHTRRRVAFTIGWAITEVEEAAIAALPEQVWSAYLRQDGTVATITDAAGQEAGYGHVAEITGLAKREGWPPDLRLIVRRVPITARDRAAGKLTDLERRTGWRYAITATNIHRMRAIAGTHQPQWLDVLHRHHAVVEDRVRVAKQTGLGHLPSASWRVNTAWTLLAAIAADLDAWTRLLGFADHDLLAKAEPATMREAVYRLPARLARHARRRWLRFDRDHPHAGAVATAWARLAALPAVT
jgi:hypothetical protein